MAKRNFEMTVNIAIRALSDWCSTSGYSMGMNGNYTVYVCTDKNETDLKITIKEILMSVLDVSKKKLNSLISILETRGRVYILFKRRICLQ